MSVANNSIGSGWASRRGAKLNVYPDVNTDVQTDGHVGSGVGDGGVAREASPAADTRRCLYVCLIEGRGRGC